MALLLAVTPLTLMAQNTSSGISGTVVDSDGTPVEGATVVVKHGPTGATKTLSTNEKGNYQARGLRVGGPYAVTVSKSGFGEVNESDLYIVLGEMRDIDATIVSDSVSLDSIQVVGVAQSVVFNADNMGTNISIDRDTLANMPTVSRSVQDFLKLDSRINIRDFGEGISVSGVNSRMNNFSIDGVSANDPFGLEAAGFAGIGQPFNIDTIEELNIQLSPYNVTLSNFTGASINAVTKSGTNEFTGSVNLQYGNESLTRDLNDFTNEILSVTAGGPIIKDKLFFFLGYEDTSFTRVANSTSVSSADIQEIIDIASSVYGIDIGTSNAPGELDITKQNILLKLDWLINESHRLAFTYNTNEDNSPQLPNLGGNRASLSSQWYTNNFQKDSYAVNVYSDWTPNFTTEIRLSTSSFDKNPVGLSNLPYVEIRRVGDGDTVYFGRERFRHANSLSVKDDTFYIEGNYFVGNHTIKGGLDIQNHDIFNTFVFDSFGNYRFDGIEDFRNGDVNRFRFNIGADPANRYPSADWAWKSTALFIQDNWMVNQDLTIQYGLRYDVPSTSDSPQTNPGFVDAYGIPNTSVINSGVLQPRFGFNYDMSDELMMQVRGGVGVFSGGSPNVWLSNPFTNPGGNIDSYQVFDGSVPFNPDGPNQPRPEGSSRSFQNVDLLSTDFTLPTVLKSNIALDMELPWYGIVSRFEFEYTKQQDAILYEHLNLGAPSGTLPDGRLSYYGNPLELGGGSETNRNRDYGDVLLAKNSGNGNIKRATISLEKRTEHFFTKASYTHTSSSEVSTLTSSRAISNWNNRPSFNPNDNETGVSSFQIENAFTFLMNYSNNFFGDTLTNIGLFWTSSDGEPYSYTFGNDINGDGVRDNDLFYVPNAGEYVLTGGNTDVDAFEAFITQAGLTRGQAVYRNSQKAPRVNLWDLKVRQELPQFGKVRASVFFSIKNLGNLLNKDWGIVKTGRFDGINIANLEGFDEQGRWLINWNGRDVDGNLFTSTLNSQWQAQIGLRFDW